jgi:hypothetical protein
MVKQIDRIFVRGDTEEFQPDFRVVVQPAEGAACSETGALA